MLLIAKREDEGYLDIESIEKFPCEELRTLDKLWVDNSDGKFGFSVQKKVWMDCGGIPGEYNYDVYKKFADQVGWRRSGNWLSYDELTFLLDGSEKAHLPGPVIKVDIEYVIAEVDMISFLAQRLVTCNIS